MVYSEEIHKLHTDFREKRIWGENLDKPGLILWVMCYERQPEPVRLKPGPSQVPLPSGPISLQFKTYDTHKHE